MLKNPDRMAGETVQSARALAALQRTPVCFLAHTSNWLKPLVTSAPGHLAPLIGTLTSDTLWLWLSLKCIEKAKWVELTRLPRVMTALLILKPCDSKHLYLKYIINN